MQRVLITTADDFGLTEGVNEAVEEAALRGMLTSASLMVAGAAAGDAIERARRLGPKLKVGLHLVVVEGPACLAPALIPRLVDDDGQFPGRQLRLGLAYGFDGAARLQLRAEIRAQFAAFAATGLALDHANAHKHMHLHPYVGAQMIAIGREFGLGAMRVPAEPLARSAPAAARALHLWTRVLRWQARRAGVAVADRVFGLADTGHMTRPVVQALVDRLPPGVTELYFHPATTRDATLARLMPSYEHQEELRALMETRLPADVRLTSYLEAFAG